MEENNTQGCRMLLRVLIFMIVIPLVPVCRTLGALRILIFGKPMR